jgi:hypothetical protein
VTAHRDGAAQGPSLFLEGDDLVIGAMTGAGAGGQFGDANLLSMSHNNAAMALGLAQDHGSGSGHMAGLGDDALAFAEGSPESSIVQMAGWGQFDSLVSSISSPLHQEKTYGEANIID